MTQDEKKALADKLAGAVLIDVLAMNDEARKQGRISALEDAVARVEFYIRALRDDGQTRDLGAYKKCVMLLTDMLNMERGGDL